MSQCFNLTRSPPMMQRTAEQVGGTSGEQTFPQTLGEFTVSSEVIFFFCCCCCCCCCCLFVFVCLFFLWHFEWNLVLAPSNLALFPGPAQLSVTRSTEKQVIKSYIAELGLGNEARIYHNLYSVDHCPSEQWHRLTLILDNDISSKEDAFTIGGNSQLAGFSRECPRVTCST